MMSIALASEFQFYLDHQNELVSLCDGKVVVILSNALIGVYDTELEAIEKTSEKHALGTFLVQKCGPGEENYTQTFHSRVVFA
jgi:hypothetical protein